MQFTKDQRFLMDAVSCMLGIFQTRKRPRRKQEDVDAAICQFLERTFAVYEHEPESDRYIVLPLCYRHFKIESDSQKSEILAAYGCDLRISNHLLSELEEVIDCLRQDVNKKHFVVNGINGRFEADVNIVSMLIEESDYNSVSGADVIAAYGRMVTKSLDVGTFEKEKFTGSERRRVLESIDKSIELNVSSSSEFGRRISKIIDHSHVNNLSQLFPDTVSFNVKMLNSTEWISFSELVCTLLVSVELYFGNYSRVKQCVVCKSLFIEERQNQKYHCSKNCSAKDAKNNNVKLTCRGKQKSIFNNIKDFVDSSIKDTEIKLKKKYKLVLPDASFCKGCPVEGELVEKKCRLLLQLNSELYAEYLDSKERKKKWACFEKNKIWLDSPSRNILDKPVFTHAFCKNCSDGYKHTKYCSKLTSALLEMNKKLTLSRVKYICSKG